MAITKLICTSGFVLILDSKFTFNFEQTFCIAWTDCMCSVEKMISSLSNHMFCKIYMV